MTIYQSPYVLYIPKILSGPNQFVRTNQINEWDDIKLINEQFSKNKKSTPKQADTYSDKALMQLDYNITE